MFIYVVEEVWYILFVYEYLCKWLLCLIWMQWFWILFYFFLMMWLLCNVIVVLFKVFWEEFDILCEVKKELFFGLLEL